MADDNGKKQASVRTVETALDEALNHIAGAHGLIDMVRKSAQDGGESEQTVRDIGRVWHSLEIAGVLATQLAKQLARAEGK